MSVSFVHKVAAAVPYVLPALGGVIGVACINMTDQGNPLVGVVIGALAGWAVAAVVVKLLDGRG